MSDDRPSTARRWATAIVNLALLPFSGPILVVLEIAGLLIARRRRSHEPVEDGAADAEEELGHVAEDLERVIEMVRAGETRAAIDECERIEGKDEAWLVAARYEEWRREKAAA